MLLKLPPKQRMKVTELMMNKDYQLMDVIKDGSFAYKVILQKPYKPTDKDLMFINVNEFGECSLVNN